MKKICLTGNIGSGKSTIAKAFENLGVPVYHADIEAKKFYNHIKVKEFLQNRFTSHSFYLNNSPDFELLAKLVFTDKQKLTELNQIIHPLVIEDFENWAQVNYGFPYVIMESAIVIENNLQSLFYKTIFISAPEELRIKRVMQRDKVSYNDVMNRISNQWSEEMKIQLSDIVLVNDGSLLIVPKVIEIHNKLMNL